MSNSRTILEDIRTSANRHKLQRNLIEIIGEVNKIYKEYGPRSSKKVDYFHNYLKTSFEKIFHSDIYEVKLEQFIESYNARGKKRCDIVINKNNKPYIIFPVKIVMTNYMQNKNNYFENLTGECTHLKWANEHINIIPINIYINQTPYLKKDKKIKKYEIIKYKDIKIQKILKDRNIVYDIIQYIFNVKHENKIGDEYTIMPTVIGFDSKTPFRSFDEIFKNLI